MRMILSIVVLTAFTIAVLLWLREFLRSRALSRQIERESKERERYRAIMRLTDRSLR